MQRKIYDATLIRRGSIVSGNEVGYLAKQSEVPCYLQPVMLQLFDQTDWAVASKGHLQTRPVAISRMATAMDVSIRTVKRHLATLVDSGELVVHERFGVFGEQLASIYTMPRLAKYLKSLKIKDVCDVLAETVEEASSVNEEGGDTPDTPLKQNSFPKRNTYIRFRNIRERSEFLAVTGSVRYVPQLLAVIRRARPGVDPDLVYRWFKEFISRPGFSLNDGIPHYFALLRIFAQKMRLPGQAPASKSRQPKEPAQSIRRPVFTGENGEFCSALWDAVGPSAYAAWFEKADFHQSNGELIVTVGTEFMRQYVSRSFADVLIGLSSKILGARCCLQSAV